MSAAAITFEVLEARAETSVGLAIFAKRMRDGLNSVISGAVLLPLLARKMDELACILKSGILERLSDQQLRELADLLKQLNALTRHVPRPVSTPRFIERYFQRIQDRSEDFESVIENIYLALDPNFHKAVSSAVDKLHLGVEESATLQR
jgi:hypothetical protein